MKERMRKGLEVILFISIIGLSIGIFLKRDQIQDVGSAGYIGLLFLCFLANSTVLLPSPSLMMAASCALIMNPFLVAVFAALGSSLGELVGYAFGTVTQDLSPGFRKLMDRLTEKIHNELVIVFLFAVLPLPLFDVVGIYSGGARMNLLKFFGACFAGKLIKMLVYTRWYDIMEWALSGYPGL